MIVLCSVAQSCPTFCDPMNWSLPDSSVHGISQARILEWVAISFSRGSYRPRDQTRISCTASGFFITEPPAKSPKHDNVIFIFFFTFLFQDIKNSLASSYSGLFLSAIHHRQCRMIVASLQP